MEPLACAPELFTTRTTFIVGPSGLGGKTALQGSPVLFVDPELVGAASVGTDMVGFITVGKPESVGKGAGVGLGSGVGLGCGVSVGTGVGGTAACVNATIVLAAATAEACIWAGSAVGVALAPHALRRKASMAAMKKMRFILYSLHFLLLNYNSVFVDRDGSFLQRKE